jgi:hypothetical protein
MDQTQGQHRFEHAPDIPLRIVRGGQSHGVQPGGMVSANGSPHHDNTCINDKVNPNKSGEIVHVQVLKSFD